MLERFASQVAMASGRVALLASILAAALLWQAVAHPVGAQEAYPSRVVRIVVPFPAGGTADILPRIVADRLSEQWRQPVIIENRAGAGGNIGAEAVAGSPPDGYVLLASPPGPIAINDNLYKKLAFQPSKFEPVIVLGTVPNVLVVKPTFPAKTAQELIAHVKANPGKITFASQGNGSTSHLSAMLFQKLTDTQMLHVPYRGPRRRCRISWATMSTCSSTTSARLCLCTPPAMCAFWPSAARAGCHRCLTCRPCRRWAWPASSRSPGSPSWPRRGRPLPLRKPSTRPSPQLCSCRA